MMRCRFIAAMDFRAFHGQIETFCLSSGEVVCAEGREAHSGAMGKRLDKADVRRKKIRRAGLVWPNAVGLRFDRAASTAFVISLGLEPNQQRQNASI
jgi:hypothetical protein